MAGVNLIETAKVLIDDMYEAMEYTSRNLNTISFTEMYEMRSMIDGISIMLDRYVTEETKDSVRTVKFHWNQLKIKMQRTLMNSRVVLA